MADSLERLAGSGPGAGSVSAGLASTTGGATAAAGSAVAGAAGAAATAGALSLIHISEPTRLALI
eukprot:8748801-Alexandrium_andersonii.AAC.1